MAAFIIDIQDFSENGIFEISLFSRRILPGYLTGFRQLVKRQVRTNVRSPALTINQTPMLKKLGEALFLDRMSNKLGLPNVEQMKAEDPLDRVLADGDRILADSIANQIASGEEDQRKRILEKEKESPGYIERLNQTRARLGLPPFQK